MTSSPLSACPLPPPPLSTSTKSSSMTRSRRRLHRLPPHFHASLWLLCAAALGAGCSGDSTEATPCGEQGVLVELPDKEVCAYKQSIVIETGFSCPAAYPTQQSFDGVTICSRSSEGLDQAEIDLVYDELVDAPGWTLEPRLPSVPVALAPIEEQKVDLLMVLDNSFSMCEEQEMLRRQIPSLIDGLERGGLDFHLGVTTTHAPASSLGVIEPVAQKAQLQNVPQPVPGNNDACLRGPDPAAAFEPLRQSLAAATSCLADPAAASRYVWSEAQLECALESDASQRQSGCVASTGLSDVTADERVDLFDLFPPSTAYRQLPKVFRRQDYLDAGGRLQRDRFLSDLRCVMTVGTRGDSYEKGLRVAVDAVSPSLTGGGGAGAGGQAANNGLIRPEARFGVMFLTDENDCSHDGTMSEIGNMCGSDLCEFMNSSALSDSESLLVPVEQLAQELRENLAATKGLNDASMLSEDAFFIASLNGTSTRYSEPFPSCQAGDKPTLEPACTSARGVAFSGDRYERFMRQFKHFYPNTILDGAADVEAARLDFSRYEPIGGICADTFAPALSEIGTRLDPEAL